MALLLYLFFLFLMLSVALVLEVQMVLLEVEVEGLLLHQEYQRGRRFLLLLLCGRTSQRLGCGQKRLSGTSLLILVSKTYFLFILR
jgi:hypothetical protein